MNLKTASKIISVLLLATVILTACGAGAPKSEAKVYRIATDATYPPFETVDEASKELVGFDIELIKAVAAEAGIEYELVNVNFDPLLAGTAQCQYDAAISAITITDERKKSMSFTDGYINAGQIVTINTENTEIKSVDDLKGKKIGVQLATTGAIEAAKIEGADVKTYDTVDLAFLDLVNKQVDAVVADYPTSLAFVKQNEGKIVTTGEPFTEEKYGIAVCQKNTELLDKLNAGLKAVIEKGTVTELEQKWLAGE